MAWPCLVLGVPCLTLSAKDAIGGLYLGRVGVYLLVEEGQALQLVSVETARKY